MADIFPGARVVEAGVGSGALTMSLLRAVGDEGLVSSYERRQDFADIARANVESFFGCAAPGLAADRRRPRPRASAETEVDRVVLDMLAPWDCLDACRARWCPAGCSSATSPPRPSCRAPPRRCASTGRSPSRSAWESLVRGWHLEGLAVRPEHRMVGHTGFLLTTRRLADGVAPPLRRRRPSKGAYGEKVAEA